MESCNTESSLDLPLESLSLQPFLQSLHKEQWQEVRLGEVAEIIGGGTPKTSIPEYWNGEIPWLTPKDLAGYNHIYISKGERFITELGLKNSSATLMPKGAILLSSRAPIGYVAIAQNDICTNQGFKSLVVEPKQACNLFVYYWIKNNVEYLQSLGTGTTFEEISKGVVQDITIPLPPLIIQQKIAEILSSFDDKIDLLHRQNKTLESLALTLFRHYSTHKELDSIIGDIIALQSGYAFKSKDFQHFGKDRILKIKNIQNSVIDIINTDFVNENISKILDSKFRIFSGDILFGMTGAEIGKMGIVPKNNETLWLNQRVGVLREKFKGAKYLAYLHLTSAFGFDYIVNAASGSAQPNISAKDIENCPFYYFTESELHNMSLQISPFFEKMIQNSGTILTLQAMRDIMLKAIFE